MGRESRRQAARSQSAPRRPWGGSPGWNRDRTPSVVRRSSGRCDGSRSVPPHAAGDSSDASRSVGRSFGNAFWYRDLHLRAREGGETLAERYIFVPVRNDGDSGGATAYRQLATPFTQEVARTCEPLSPAAIAKPTHAADHGLLERHPVIPPISELP